MLRPPREQLRVGVPAGIDVDEGCPCRLQGQGEIAGKVPSPSLGVAGIVTAREQPPGQAQRLQRPDLLPLGGKPPRLGVIEDVIEREQAAEPDPGGGPGVRDALEVQCPVQGLGGDAARPGGGGKAVQGLLDAVAASEEAADEAQGPVAPAAEMGAELGAGEPAAVAADQGDPLGLGTAPAEALQHVGGRHRTRRAQSGDRRGAGRRGDAADPDPRRLLDAGPAGGRLGGPLLELASSGEQGLAHAPGVRGGPHQLPGIGLEELDPALGVDVPMAGPVAESDPGAGHQGPDLGPELFAGGIGRVRLAPKGGQQDRTVAPVRVAGSVTEFVQEGLIIALRAAESVRRRQDDPILSQMVTGSVSGFVETVHAAGQQHELDPFLPRPGRSVPVPELREEQALGLIDVEKSGRALYRAILRRRALRRLGIKILGREAEDARPVLGNPAAGGFDPGPGAPAGIRVSLLDGPAEKMQSLDAGVGLPGREALGPDPVLGGVVALPGGLAVAELVEDPPGEGLQHRARFGGWGSAAPEHENRTSSASAGLETGSRGLRIHPGENPCQDLRWGSDADSLVAEIRIHWLPGALPGYDRVGRCQWRSGCAPGWRKLADAQGLKSCGGSPSVWVRLPPRVLLKVAHPLADKDIESLFPSLAGDLWAPRVGPRCGG